VDPVDLSLVQEGDGEFVAILRRHLHQSRWLLIVVNLSDAAPVTARWLDERLPALSPHFTDLLTGERVSPAADGAVSRLPLAGGQVRCLSPESRDLAELERRIGAPGAFFDAVTRQRARSLVLDICRHLDGQPVISPDVDMTAAVASLLQDPAAFYRSLVGAEKERQLVHWRWPEDLRRTVMLPPGHALLVTADASLRVRVSTDGAVIAGSDSFPLPDGRHFCLLPIPAPPAPQGADLDIWYHGGGSRRRTQAPLRLLPDGRYTPDVVFTYDRRAVLNHPLLYLGTNGRGGMLRAHARWGRLASRYDALLAANPDPVVPVDRWVLLTRCRMWVVFQDYSMSVNEDCLATLDVIPGDRAQWLYDVPVGQGEHVRLVLGLRMPDGLERIALTCHRASGTHGNHLDDALPIRVIVRPDIESRSFHDTTKAFQGAEHQWPAAVTQLATGFSFTPDGVPGLRMTADRGRFVDEPEWHYMVHRPQEAERGLDPDSDLFSPGYFTMDISGGETAVLTAGMMDAPGHGGGDGPMTESAPESPASAATDFESRIAAALDQYVVKRDDGRSVVAGYPWFLDWGRDTLIACRGLLAAGRIDTVTTIVAAYARLEKGGTLPNMLSGADDSNRNTSDAPLWLMVVCRELFEIAGDAVGDLACGGRSLKTVLMDLTRALEAGAANGVRMDADTGLLYSPTHFTWMDTNHPAGTPREGYPIDIQALWQASLGFMATIASGNDARRWAALQRRVRHAIGERYFLPEKGYLSDCLHAAPDVPCGAAAPDDALRPNQLLALTLDALDDREMAVNVLDACQRLLVPGAIRSLADQPVTRPLVITRQGEVLGDPHRPYRGRYTGDEDTQRKPAYHNGTAWTWPYPSYAEAWYRVYGETGKTTARAYLIASLPLMRTGCMGHLPEILDGDSPHTARGCDAQAWGLSEWLRVWRLVA
jgi:starch synthase (maltosyl-transferring)